MLIFSNSDLFLFIFACSIHFTVGKYSKNNLRLDSNRVRSNCSFNWATTTALYFATIFTSEVCPFYFHQVFANIIPGKGISRHVFAKLLFEKEKIPNFLNHLRTRFSNVEDHFCEPYLLLANSVNRWLNYLAICNIEIFPIAFFGQSRFKIFLILYLNRQKICQRLLQFCQSDKILPNLTTLFAIEAFPTMFV